MIKNNESLTETYKKAEKYSAIFGTLMGLLNSILWTMLMIQAMGIQIKAKKVKITRELLLQYEPYFRYLIFFLGFFSYFDMWITRHYWYNYGTKPPRNYRIFYSILNAGVGFILYYIYLIPLYLYFAVLGGLSLANILIFESPIESNIQQRGYFKKG